jgi:hypothetical protein
MLPFRNISYNTPLIRDFSLECAAPELFRARHFESKYLKLMRRDPLSKIARRKFIQLSAVAAAGYLANPGREAVAQDLPHITPDDAMAGAMKYTHDASTVDPGSRTNPAPDQTCANCALVTGNDGDEWRPCQIFPGKAVNAKGWCSVWAPKA